MKDKASIEKEIKKLQKALDKILAKERDAEYKAREKLQDSCKHSFGEWRSGHNCSFASCSKCDYITQGD